MSFEVIDSTRACSTKKSASLVAVSVNAGEKRTTRYITLSFRPLLLKCAWLQAGEHIKIELGTDNDAGWLRITPNGAHLIVRSGGIATIEQERNMAVKIPVFPGIGKGAFARTSCVFLLTEKEKILMVQLPRWAVSERASNPTSVAPSPPHQPYKMGAPSHADMLKRQGLR